MDDSSTPSSKRDATGKRATESSQPKRQLRFKAWYKRHKKWTIPATIVLSLAVVVGTLCLVPSTRYAMLSPFVHRTYGVTITDAQSNNPVSGVKISLGEHSATTDKHGKAELKQVPVGRYSLTASKPLYDNSLLDVIVPVFGEAQRAIVLKANGVRLSVTVNDRISGKPLDGATVTVGEASTQTRSDGIAEVVVPVDAKTTDMHISSDGYVAAQSTLAQDGENTVDLVKTGKLYFLSKQSGTLDVVSTNLDGTDRTVVLQGTGNEDDRSASLLAARDWKYLALKAKRDTTREALYIIDTANAHATRVTSGETYITPVGWSNNRFVYQEYQADSNGYQTDLDWTLRSVQASDKRVATLEKAETATTYHGFTANQYIGSPYILDGDTIVYSSAWYGPYNGGTVLDNKSGVIAVQSDGSQRRYLKEYPSEEIDYIQTKLYKPQEIHFRVFNIGGERRENLMTVNKKIELVPPAQQKFDQEYPTFLISPDGKRSFWAEARDGKNALFVGGNNAENPEQLVTLSEYAPYGWLTDEYLLMQKNGSELFITTPEQIKAGAEPIKVSDYHKPFYSLYGYGYGYGGL